MNLSFFLMLCFSISPLSLFIASSCSVWIILAFALLLSLTLTWRTQEEGIFISPVGWMGQNSWYWAAQETFEESGKKENSSAASSVHLVQLHMFRLAVCELSTPVHYHLCLRDTISIPYLLENWFLTMYRFLLNSFQISVMTTRTGYKKHANINRPKWSLHPPNPPNPHQTIHTPCCL